MTNKINNKDDADLVVIFFKITKALAEADEIIKKYKHVELHQALAKMYKGMEEFSAKMIEISIEVSNGHH